MRSPGNAGSCSAPNRCCWAVLLLLGLSILSGCTADICNSDELSSALARAFDGDTVRVGSCSLSGAFTVPAGVTLIGAGQSDTVFRSAGDEPVIRLEGGSVADLSVESEGLMGILASGAGKVVSVERVRVEARRGVALGVDGVAVAELRAVELLGPITAPAAADLLEPPVPELTATHGLVLSHVGEATLEEVAASGFARFGALLIDSSTRWQGGGAWENVGAGLLVHSGDALLRDIRLCSSLEPMYELRPAYEAVFAAGADVETHNITVCDGQGVGLLHDAVLSALHRDLSATQNAEAALWVQHSENVEVSGDTVMVDNGLAGVVLVDTANATIDGGSIGTTVGVPATCGYISGGICRVGDGVQIVNPTGAVQLSNLALRNNERVGVLLTLESSSVGTVGFDAVEVDGAGEQLGAIGQGDGVVEGWDSGLLRRGATTTNDPAHTGGLGVLRPKQPFEIPAGDGDLPYIE